MSFAGKAHQVMLQGVHELYELNETPQLWEENLRINRLVFIGEDVRTLHSWIQQCLLHISHYHPNDFTSICDHAAMKFMRLCSVLQEETWIRTFCRNNSSLQWCREQTENSRQLLSCCTENCFVAFGHPEIGDCVSNIRSFPMRA